MNKKFFIEYSERLFSILFEYENLLRKKNLLSLGDKERITAGTRFLGCLGERLINLFILQKKYECCSISNCGIKVFLDE